MYGKVFASIFDGSLHGKFEATTVMMALIALADKDGAVDMTPEALAARTGFPLDLIQRGIADLCKPDPRSRSKEEEGRRLVLIDPERDWGWILVNHAKYRGIRSNEDRRDYMRDYMAARRSVNNVNQPLTHLAYTEADTEADTEAVNKKSARKRASPVDKPVDVSEKTWNAWLKVRKERRAAVTDLAVDGVRREASNAGMTIEEALVICCERGWAGFNAGWNGVSRGADIDAVMRQLEAEGRG